MKKRKWWCGVFVVPMMQFFLFLWLWAKYVIYGCLFFFRYNYLIILFPLPPTPTPTHTPPLCLLLLLYRLGRGTHVLLCFFAGACKTFSKWNRLMVPAEFDGGGASRCVVGFTCQADHNHLPCQLVGSSCAVNTCRKYMCWPACLPASPPPDRVGKKKKRKNLPLLLLLNLVCSHVSPRLQSKYILREEGKVI